MKFRFGLKKSKEKKQERMEKAVVVVQEEQDKLIHEVFKRFILFYFYFDEFLMF